MLGIEHHLGACGSSHDDALGDHLQVLVLGDAEATSTWKSHALADHADRLNLGVQQALRPGSLAALRPAAGSCRTRPAWPASGSGGWREERIVGRVGARPAALDIVDADPVESQGDGRLIVRAEIDALGLAPSRNVLSNK
jgi:hypothetical protein